MSPRAHAIGIQSKIDNQPPQIAIRVRVRRGLWIRGIRQRGHVARPEEDSDRCADGAVSRRTAALRLCAASRNVKQEQNTRQVRRLDGSPVRSNKSTWSGSRASGPMCISMCCRRSETTTCHRSCEEQQLQLMRSRNRGVQANEYGVKPTPKISPEYDYLPVVSYAEAADKARLGPLLAKIREIARERRYTITKTRPDHAREDPSGSHVARPCP